MFSMKARIAHKVRRAMAHLEFVRATTRSRRCLHTSIARGGGGGVVQTSKGVAAGKHRTEATLVTLRRQLLRLPVWGHPVIYSETRRMHLLQPMLLCGCCEAEVVGRYQQRHNAQQVRPCGGRELAQCVNGSDVGSSHQIRLRIPSLTCVQVCTKEYLRMSTLCGYRTKTQKNAFLELCCPPGNTMHVVLSNERAVRQSRHIII